MELKCLKTMHLSQVGANLLTVVTPGQDSAKILVFKRNRLYY